MKPHIAYFISPHGFGHAARSAATINAIHTIDPSIIFDIFTKVPEWFFSESIKSGFNYFEMLTDIGISQETPLQENLPDTLRQLKTFIPFDKKLIADISETLKNNECELVICDISPLGIAVAKHAEIPMVLVENFTWDWIYQEYHDQYPDFKKYSDYLYEIFKSVDYHIQAEPVCEYWENACLITQPIGRKPLTSAAKTRLKLGLPEGAKMVLITMGESGKYSISSTSWNIKKILSLSFLVGVINSHYLKM